MVDGETEARTIKWKTITDILMKAPDVLGALLEDENRAKLQQVRKDIGDMDEEVEEALQEIIETVQEAVEAISVLSKQAASALCDVIADALKKADVEIDWPEMRELVNEADLETQERFKRALWAAVEPMRPV